MPSFDSALEYHRGNKHNMTTSVHISYNCDHTLKLRDDLVPIWLLKEYFGAVEFDPNTWQGVNHDYGTITVDDLCGICKEEAAQKRRRDAGKTRQEGKGANTAATSPSTASEKSTDSTGPC